MSDPVPVRAGRARSVRSKPRVTKRYYTRLMDLYRYAPVRTGLLNPVIRSVFAYKARRDVSAMRRRAIPPERVAAWFDARPVFFCLAVPRSGSMFLAGLLNEASPDTIVLHEPNVNDYYYYHVALRDQTTAEPYLTEYRLAETVIRLEPFECRVYGEINPFLRRHAAAIRRVLPYAGTLHLVRDGRRVVRSLLSREHFDVNDPMAPLKVPPEDDEYFPAWPRMTRFERLCWLWQADNRYLREHAERTIRFEDLMEDFEHLRERVLEPWGLGIDEATWRLRRERATNRTPRYRAPPFEGWSPEWKRAFERICGQEMEANGYRL